MGQDAPHLIVYPAVVGCSTSLPKYLLNKGKEGEGKNFLDMRKESITSSSNKRTKTFICIVLQTFVRLL